MKTIHLALTFVFASLSGCCWMPAVPDTKGPTVVELVQAIDSAWATSSNSIETLGLKLDSIKLTLQAKNSTEIGGELEVLVVSASASQELASSQSLTISLVEPHPAAGAQQLQSKLDIQGEVAAAIQRVAKTAAAVMATGPAANNTTKPLALDEISASIGFDVTTTSKGGLQLKLGTVQIGPSISHTVTGSQEIELAFKRK